MQYISIPLLALSLMYSFYVNASDKCFGDIPNTELTSQSADFKDKDQLSVNIQTSNVSENTRIGKLLAAIKEDSKRHNSMMSHIQKQKEVYEFELEALNEILKNPDPEVRFSLQNDLSSKIEKLNSSKSYTDSHGPLVYLKRFDTEDEQIQFLQKCRLEIAKERNEIQNKMITERGILFQKVAEKRASLQLSLNKLEQEILDSAQAKESKAMALAQQEQKRLEAIANFNKLGKCEVGETVYHREIWDTETSSGNVLADYAFGSSTKEQFIITYEAVVESFLGSKVKTIINDYSIQQTLGGGFLDPKTYKLNDLTKYADKFIGKVQFYDKGRCTL